GRYRSGWNGRRALVLLRCSGMRSHRQSLHGILGDCQRSEAHMPDPVDGVPASAVTPDRLGAPLEAAERPGALTVRSDQLLDALPDPTYVVDVDLAGDPGACSV